MVTRIVKVSTEGLPINVAPDMACDLLTKIPEDGEEIFLGKDTENFYPWNVTVRKA